MPLSLLITTRDREADLLRTLAVMAPTFIPRNEIIVLVDGSRDGSAARVAREFPQITVIMQNPAQGLIAARNRLLNCAKGTFAISLDDDAEIITPGFGSIILDYFANHPRCAVIAFAIHWGAAPPALRSRPEEQSCRIRSFVGCGHVWRTEAWRRIPSYPEWFQMYGEEDFASLQLLKHGWEVHYLPQVMVHHRVAGGPQRNQERLWRYRRQFRSGLFLMFLFFPLTAIPKRCLYAFWTQVRTRLFEQSDWGVARTLVLVLVDVVRYLPRMLRSRIRLTGEQWDQWKKLPSTRVYQESGRD